MNRTKTVSRGRLIWWGENTDEEYWHQHFVSKIMTSHAQKKVTSLEKILLHYLPKQGRILEAGCGTGWVVAALLQHGLDVEGVDYSESLIEEVKKYKPELPVSVGDVCHLQVPDNHYAGYISIGVIEHRRDGPEPFLWEAHRVIMPGGIACISVPYFNPARRVKAKLGRYNSSSDNLDFYQYGFSKDEFTKYLNEYGFAVEDCVYYGTVRNFQEEFASLYSFLVYRRFLSRLPSLLDNFDFLGLTHMIMAVARKV